jgi:hypothetical protein
MSQSIEKFKFHAFGELVASLNRSHDVQAWSAVVAIDRLSCPSYVGENSLAEVSAEE